ncbi:MAG: hypothetical protein FWD31_08180, partial [Planctomycetaceae bacterium]|nr:hypothetical protein [Planctomycetaceae bacterium]
DSANHQNVIQVCVMDQNRKILVNQAIANDPAAVLRVVAPFGSNVHAAGEASTGVAEFAEQVHDDPVVKQLLRQPGIGMIVLLRRWPRYVR